ncbi:GumC family protein [Thioclava kandeliae]|uniref:Wzz/FepE/Etk N-terminal domain-containing protein n=1 Tax=Thioclava kandeliae TaxID=3070818 RepID=A0ABV1SLS7_9RHOB
MNTELKFYLSLFWRKLPLFLAVFVLLTACGLFAAATLPPVYRSQARLVVESSQIPGNLAQSTVNVSAQQQLQLFESRLMTRENLLDIATRLHALPNQDDLNPDQIVQAMRAATKISSSTGRNQATLMTISFENVDPRMTARVLDEYLTFILAQDADYRAQIAGQTQDFFQQEVDALGNKLAEQGAKILKFQNEHADALPSGLQFARDQIQALNEQNAQIDRNVATANDQKTRLQQVFDATGSIGSTGRALSPEEQNLQTLRSQLANLEAVYAPDSPKVTSLRNRISNMEKSLARMQGGNAQTTSDPARAMLDMQLSQIDDQIKQMQATREGNVKQLALLQDQISRTPANDIALQALQRDYDNIQVQYNGAVSRLAQASTGERIETLSRGQRVSVLEQPSVPDQPIKPNRKKIAVMGAVAGLIAGSGLIALLHFLSGTIKRSADMISSLGITPMITLPYVRSREEIIRTRVMRISVSLGIFVAIPFALLMIHLYYMPFNELAQKIAARIGFYI